MVAPHRIRSRVAWIVPLIAVVLVVACVLVAPAGALRQVSRSTTGNMFYSISWGGEFLVPFSKRRRSPRRPPSIDGLFRRLHTTEKAAPTPDGVGLDIRCETLGDISHLWGGPGDRLQPAVSDGLIAGLDQAGQGVRSGDGNAVTMSDAAAQTGSPGLRRLSRRPGGPPQRLLGHLRAQLRSSSRAAHR